MNKAMKSAAFLIVPVIGLMLANCAGTPDMNPVQKAQHEFEQIASDTLVVNNAPVALKKAGEAVEAVQESVRNNEAPASVEQQVYVARQRVKIARTKAKLNVAQGEVQRLSKELQTLLNSVREAELSEMEAEERAKQLVNFAARETNRGLVLRFLSVNFDPEKAYLKSSAEPPINELAEFLDAYPERRIIVEGHTDNTGAASFNKTLSQQRADAVRDALISRGIAASRIEAIGLGEQYPRANNNTEAGRQRNRRVEVIISDTSGTIPPREE